MKCPYCDQEHPDDIDMCPITGKPLGQTALPSSPQGAQTGDNPNAEETAHAKLEPEGEEQVPTEKNPPVSQAVEALHTQEANPAVMEPQPADVMPAQPEPAPLVGASAEPTGLVKTTKRRGTARWVIGCVGVPLALLLLLAVFAFADPFNLHLWGRVTGRYDAAAEVMPADIGLYLGINIGNGMITHIDRVVTPFLPTEQASSGVGYQPAPVNPRYAQPADPFDALFQQIEAETGMRIPEDISPWVGQYAGIGAVDFTDSGSGPPAPTGWIMAVEARNNPRADAFLDTLQKNLTDLQGMEFERQTYKGVNLFAMTKDIDQNGLAIGRSGRMVIIGSSLPVFKEAIDRQASQALPAEKDYIDLINVRPLSWTASVYINHQWVGDYLEKMMAGTVSPAMPLINPYSGINWTGMLLNVSAIKQGARLDVYVGFDPTLQTGAGGNQWQETYAPPTQVIGMLPQDTVIFLANNRFDLVVQGLMGTASMDEPQASALWESLNQTLGFSMQDDLLDQLTGEWVLYAVPSTRGLLPKQADLNMALSLLVKTDGELDLQPITDGINSTFLYTGFSATKQERDGIAYYELGGTGENEPILAFGANNGYFTLGTDGEKLQLAPVDKKSLVNSTNYRIALDALPGGMKPAIYIDLENLFANLREGMDASQRGSFDETISQWEPLKIVASGNRLLHENVVHSSIVIILANR